MHEGVWLKNLYYNKMTAMRNVFTYMTFVYAWILPLWTDQLLPQLLMDLFDTLPLQCRHIERMHEGIWYGIFILTQ